MSERFQGAEQPFESEIAAARMLLFLYMMLWVLRLRTLSALLGMLEVCGGGGECMSSRCSYLDVAGGKSPHCLTPPLQLPH